MIQKLCETFTTFSLKVYLVCVAVIRLCFFLKFLHILFNLSAYLTPRHVYLTHLYLQSHSKLHQQVEVSASSTITSGEFNKIIINQTSS